MFILQTSISVGVIVFCGVFLGLIMTDFIRSNVLQMIFIVIIVVGCLSAAFFTIKEQFDNRKLVEEVVETPVPITNEQLQMELEQIQEQLDELLEKIQTQEKP